jgi:hypothetical protein
MEVTSIRLERSLKDRLKVLAGEQGYQALIREVLWAYVNQHSQDFKSQCSPEDIRISISAIARQEGRCAITGRRILPEEEILLGLTKEGSWVTLSRNSL